MSSSTPVGSGSPSPYMHEDDAGEMSRAMIDMFREDAAEAAARRAEIAALVTGAEVSPEMILAITEQRLADANEQVTSLMNAMTQTTESAHAVSARLLELREISTQLEPAFGTGALPPNQRLEGVVGDRAAAEEIVASFVPGNITQAEADQILGSPDGLRTLIASLNSSNPLRATQVHNCFQDRGLADPEGNFTPAVATVERYLSSLVADGTLTSTERDAILAGGRDALNNLTTQASDQLRDINSDNEMLMIKLQSTMQSRTTILQTATNLLKTIDEGNDSIVANLR